MPPAAAAAAKRPRLGEADVGPAARSPDPNYGGGAGGVPDLVVQVDAPTCCHCHERALTAGALDFLGVCQECSGHAASTMDEDDDGTQPPGLSDSDEDSDSDMMEEDLSDADLELIQMVEDALGEHEDDVAPGPAADDEWDYDGGQFQDDGEEEGARGRDVLRLEPAARQYKLL